MKNYTVFVNVLDHKVMQNQVQAHWEDCQEQWQPQSVLDILGFLFEFLQI